MSLIILANPQTPHPPKKQNKKKKRTIMKPSSSFHWTAAQETNKRRDKKEDRSLAWRVGLDTEHSWVGSSSSILRWWLTSTSPMIRELKPISVPVLKTGNNIPKREGHGPAPSPNPGGNYTPACQWKCWQPAADGFILVRTDGEGIVLYHTPSWAPCRWQGDSMCKPQAVAAGNCDV